MQSSIRLLQRQPAGRKGAVHLQFFLIGLCACDLELQRSSRCLSLQVLLAGDICLRSETLPEHWLDGWSLAGSGG